MNNRKSWECVATSKDNHRVIIEPPSEVDDVYDDLWIEITGNILREDKIKLANKIAKILNEHYKDS